MAGFFQTLAELITSALQPGASATLPPAPQVIANLGNFLDNLKDLSIEIDGDLSKLQRLLDKFNALPGDAADSILVRMLQHRYPRVAEALTFLDIIRFEYEGDTLKRNRIAWDRINQLLGNPGLLATSALAKIPDNEPDKFLVNLHLLTVQLAGLMLAPRPLLLMEHNRLGFAALPVTPDDPPLGFTAGNPLKPINDAPSLFKLEIPTPAVLQNLAPNTDGVKVFLDYLEDHAISFDPHVNLPTLDPPMIGTPPVATPAFHPGSTQFGLAVVANERAELFRSFNDVAPGYQVTVDGPGGRPGFLLIFDGDRWSLNANMDGNAPHDFTATLRRTNPEKMTLLQLAGLSLTLDSLEAFARLPAPGEAGPVFSLGLNLRGLRAKLSSAYLEALGVTDALEVALDVSTAYDEGRGLRIAGAGGANGGAPALGIDFVQPVNQGFSAGPLSFTLREARLRLESGFENGGLALRAALRMSVSAVLGPVSATMDGFGAWAGLSGGRNFELLAPSGIGISIDAQIITGGGFLAEMPPGSQRFGGAIQLKLWAFGIGAFGIYEEIDGEPSLIVVIGARFPGLQLGFGFMITGVGGVLGTNRRADVDAISARLASGAAGNVLFCDDPVRNAPGLLGDLAAFFPVAKGVHIVGPTLQLSWLYIVRLDIGVLIELPGPSKVLIAGSARAVIPGLGDLVPLVSLRIDLFGGVDRTVPMFFFDASLVDSTVLGILTVSGDSSFRFGYGSNPYVLLSIGGFHPSFNPEPIKIRRLARASAGFSIDAGIRVWLRQELYFAFTPNTLQLGGRTEAGLEIGPVGAHGFFAFDALVQFKPFYFRFDFSAGFDIEFDGVSLCSVGLDGHVSGPGPLVISASVSFKILFVRFGFDTTFTLGSGNGDVQGVDLDVLGELLKEVALVDNIHTEDAERTVVLKRSAEKDIALVSPASSIRWTERVAPFDARLDRLGGTPLARQFNVSLAADFGVAGDATEVFGLGSYANVSQSEALNNNAFHRLKAGIVLAGKVSEEGVAQAKTLTIDVRHIPSRSKFPFTVSMVSLHSDLYGAMAAAAGRAQAQAVEPIVKVQEERWQAHTERGVVADGVSAFQAFQEARAQGGIAAPAGEKLVDLTGV